MTSEQSKNKPNNVSQLHEGQTMDSQNVQSISLIREKGKVLQPWNFQMPHDDGLTILTSISNSGHKTKEKAWFVSQLCS